MLATLIRLLGDFDAAEEALQDAFTIAVTQWERDGVPSNPRAWLISTGRNRTVDRIRRDDWLVRFANTLALPSEPVVMPEEPRTRKTAWTTIRRLIFTCCHPALARESQVALTPARFAG